MCIKIRNSIILTIIFFLSNTSQALDKPYWELIGPGEIDQAYSLSISQKGVVYLGTSDGGVWHSIDHGESWLPLTYGLKSYDVETPVLIDTSDDKILYVGTRGGFYKSNDYGKTWESKWKGVARGKPGYFEITACIGSIAFDPDNSKIIYMGFGHSYRGAEKTVKWGDFYRSNDKGETWDIISSLGKGVKIWDINVVSSKIIFVASSSGLFKSEDGGISWKNILNVPAKCTISHPFNRDIIYLAAGEEGVYKSLDTGNNWVKTSNGLYLTKVPFSTIQVNNYSRIVIDIETPDILYVVNKTWGNGGGVYKSINGGDSWEKITRWEWEDNTNVEAAWLKSSNRVNTIAIDPQNSQRIFIGTSRYIYKSENGGNSWQQLVSRKVTNDTWTHRGINIFGHTRVVGIDPVNSYRLYIGTADHGLIKSIDGGKSWKQSIKGMGCEGNIYDIAIDKKNPHIIFAIHGPCGFKEAGVVKSNDFGENWLQLNNGLEKKMYYTLLIDYEKSNVIYIGGESGVYKTNNSGEKWIPINKGLESVKVVRKLVFHPKDKHIIFVATDKGLYKSVDAGNSWRKMHKQEMNFYTVIVDSDNPNTMYAGAVNDGTRKLEGGVFKSKDGGKNWKKVLNLRSIESMALIPTKPTIIYAVSNDFQYHDESCGEGVFRSIDGGLSWESVNDGLPVLRGFNINIDHTPPYKLYLSTNGSGVYVATDPILSKYKDNTIHLN